MGVLVMGHLYSYSHLDEDGVQGFHSWLGTQPPAPL